MAGDAPQREGARVCLGIVTAAHGLKGLVRVRPFTGTPEDVAAYGPLESEDGARRFSLSVLNRVGKGQVLARIEGVEGRDAAEALRGQRLYVDRDRLPAPEEDEFYHADLIGLAVEDAVGAMLGRVRAVYDFGGVDSLEVAMADGRLAMIPFTRAAVPTVDLAGARVVVDAAALLLPGGQAAGTAREEEGDG